MCVSGHLIILRVLEKGGDSRGQSVVLFQGVFFQAFVKVGAVLKGRGGKKEELKRH